MAKFCTNCGHALNEGNKFCAECGAAADGTAKQSQPVLWEYCDIVFTAQGFLNMKSFFWAKAIGPRGVYEAARSQRRFMAEYMGAGVIQATASTDAVQACDEVVQAVIAAGWEPTGKGDAWFSYKFRRQVGK